MAAAAARLRGAALYLATAADTVLAERVAAYLGIFEGVLASDGATNLAGGEQAGGFRRRGFGEEFCYIGNALPDAGPAGGVLRRRWWRTRFGRCGGDAQAARKPLPPAFDGPHASLKSWLRAVRLHQWAKNTLIFVPLLLAHAWKLAARCWAR